MDARITEAARLVEEAKADLRRIAAEVQTACPHARVYHCERECDTTRICADCGLEEEARRYGANAEDFVKLSTDFVANSHQVYPYRVPHDCGEVLLVEYGRYRDEPTPSPDTTGAKHG